MIKSRFFSAGICPALRGVHFQHVVAITRKPTEVEDKIKEFNCYLDETVSEQSKVENEFPHFHSPSATEKIDIAKLMKLVNLFNMVIQVNAGKAVKPDNFTAPSSNNISIEEYLLRFYDYTMFSEETYFCMLVYIDRYVKARETCLHSLNVYRLIATGIIMASKLYNDMYYANKHIAKVSCLSADELFTLEIHFFQVLNYDLHISPDEYNQYVNEVNLFNVNDNVSNKVFKR